MKRRIPGPRFGGVTGALALVLLLGCTGPSGNDVYFPILPPPPTAGPDAGSLAGQATTNFHAVADVFVTHCGTLDCHGSSVRPFRVYNVDGIRLRPNVSGKFGTTDEEYIKTYESLVMIQPEVLSQIYREHGARPERWIVITKGRGAEHHKGGTRMRVGDPADHCITSWIASQTDLAACATASIVQAPLLPDGGAAF